MSSLTWQRRGQGWIHSDQSSGRWRISKSEVFHGTNYCAWDWYAETWAPSLLGVYDTADKAKVKCDEAFRSQ